MLPRATIWKRRRAEMKHCKRLAAALLAAALLVGLCGCGTQVAHVNVEKDGAGTITAFVGSTKEALEELAAYSGEKPAELNLESLEQFQYAGHTYYGRRLERNFTSPADLKLEFTTSSQNEDESLPFEGREALDFGDIQLEKLSDGNMLLLVTITADMSAEDEGMDPEVKAIMERYEDTFAKVLSFQFPGEVQQSGGCFNGIEVDGRDLTLDYIKMAQNSCQAYSFRITIPTTGAPPIEETRTFNDVPSDAWYADAVAFMSQNGLVSGYGGGKFGPNDNVTIAQFAQILARAQALETGAGENNWWAEKALGNCLEKGWLTDRGPVNRENYDTTIRRQEAIAAMQRASQRTAIEGNNYTLEDIPDHENICEKYRKDVVAAYNSGITAGVDSKGTMLPLNTLTRAEACQLFYVLRWGSPQGVKSLAIMDDGAFMKVGSRMALTLVLPDGVTDSMVVWASNAPSVATVSRGLVTAVSEGVATISASVGMETVSCVVVVEK